MKTVLLISLLIILTFIIYFIYIGHNSKSKDVPGLTGGHLLKCPNTPNCYNTEMPEHAGHYISPIKFSADTPNSFSMIKDIVVNIGGVIQTENSNYFSATFTSTVFGFVDDLEVKIDKEKKLLHIRSASRVGRSDLGVNKKRILLIKKLFKNTALTTDKI